MVSLVCWCTKTPLPCKRASARLSVREAVKHGFWCRLSGWDSEGGMGKARGRKRKQRSECQLTTKSSYVNLDFSSRRWRDPPRSLRNAAAAAVENALRVITETASSSVSSFFPGSYFKREISSRHKFLLPEKPRFVWSSLHVAAFNIQQNVGRLEPVNEVLYIYLFIPRKQPCIVYSSNRILWLPPCDKYCILWLLARLDLVFWQSKYYRLVTNIG